MAYWENGGKYQDEYDELVKLIPDSGECKDSNLELLRLGSNAYYDIYNNGACNSSRFRLLHKALAEKYDKAPENYNKGDWYTLLRFLMDAQEEDRQMYLFQWGRKQTKFQKNLLNVFEEFIDWAIITTYKKYKE